jgi:hypothetical protein
MNSHLFFKAVICSFAVIFYGCQSNTENGQSRSQKTVTSLIQYGVDIKSPHADEPYEMVDWHVDNINERERIDLTADILKKATDGQVPLYRDFPIELKGSELYLKKLLPEDLKKDLNPIKIIKMQNLDSDDFEIVEVVDPIVPESITRIYFMEVWTKDINSGILSKETILQGPAVKVFDDYGEILGHKILFWTLNESRTSTNIKLVITE